MVSVADYGPRGPWFETWPGNPGSRGVRLTWAGCDEAGDYIVPNVLTPRDLVSKPDNMDGTVLHS